MLPNRMQLNHQTEEQLKRLKSYTGLTPNISARLAFFFSIESGFRYKENSTIDKLDGSLVLDKITWLGETLQLTELTLKMLYPNYNEKEMHKIWVAHVQDGIAPLRNYKNLRDFTHAL
ncbi:DNA sulfur modification protein DndE [Enterobacter ludwigii]|uniref:DNA sulfur modification protein DndE n=1 Tax=Enterobacter ludwigii TaxID=299767 RepID=UPI00397474C0